MRRVLHWLGVHTWEKRTSEYWTLDRGVIGYEVYERCQYCHTGRPGSWHLEVN